MFKNLQTYRLPAPYSLTAAELIKVITPQAFVPCSSHEAMRQGWVAPREGGELVHVINKQMLLRLRTQTKHLPGSVVNKEVEVRARALEEQQGFPPGKKSRKELKERVTDELLVKAFAKDSDTWVWIDPVNGWLIVDSAGASKADDVIKLLLKAVDRMPVESLRVQRSPVAMMTGWLEADESPAGFTMDQDATLRATGESKASVTYKRHSLEPADMLRHIKAGKQCVRLAMTWNDRISFVLTESLVVKSIRPLDVLKENSVSPRDHDERFDNDMVLMTGELAKLLAALVEALGGEATVGAPGQDRQHVIAAGTPSPADADADLDSGEGSSDDELYPQAVTVVRSNQRASISLVQRHLRIGYNRAARLLERMETEGVVSPMLPNGNREVIQ